MLQKLFGLVILVIVFVMGWGPNIQALAQPALSNYSQVISDIQNNKTNDDIAVMIINCAGADSRYEDLYQGLKETPYGEELKLKAAICDHNVLYYYGICEQVISNINITKDLPRECYGAQYYLEDHGLLNESRPHDFVYDSEITK